MTFISVAGAIAYAILYTVALVLAIVMTERKKAAAATVTVLFALPLAIAGVLDGARAAIEAYGEFKVCRAAAGQERIEQKVGGARGLTVMVEHDERALPSEFRMLMRPENVLAMGYEYVQYGRERFAESSQDHAVSTWTQEDPEFRAHIELQRDESGSSGPIDKVILSVRNWADGTLVARKAWAIERSTGRLCPRAASGNPAQEFLREVLVPPADRRRLAATRSLEVDAALLADFPARLESAKVLAARQRPSNCGDSVEVFDPSKLVVAWDQRPPVLRVRDGSEVRTLYMTGMLPRSAYCSGETIYLTGEIPGSPNLLRLFAFGRGTQPARSYLVRFRGAGLDVQAPLVPEMLEFSATGDSVRLKRAHLYAPLNLNEPSVRVAHAYTARFSLAPPEADTRR